MHILNVLDTMETFEGMMAETYEWLSEIFADDEDAAAFFTRMSRDEVGHRNLVRYEKKLVRENPTAFGEVTVKPEIIDEAIRKVELFRRSEPPPTLTQALTFSMMMENDVVERLHRDAILMTNPTLAGLINSLARADAAHEKELESFINDRRELFETA